MGIVSHFPGGGGGGGESFFYSVTNVSISYDTATSLKLKWTNPEISTGWTGTKIVYKAGSAPENPTDGTVVDCGTTDYSTNAKAISGLTTGTTYYFVVMAYSGGKISFTYSALVSKVSLGTFANTPWNVIATISEAGEAANVWNVGDTKTVSFSSAILGSTSITVKILDFNYDDINGGGKAGMTIGMVDCFATTQAMNPSNTNAGGWSGCALHSTIVNTILPALEAAIGSNVIKTVDKKTSAGNDLATINTSQDKLWLLSEYEIFGATTYSFAGEKPADINRCYAAFTDANSRIKKVNGSVSFWWERSPYSGSATYFCGVLSSGTASANGAVGAFGVALGFCV
jgi:hypothetical protein